MPFIQWDASYSVSNAAIDAQHRELITILNDVFEIMKSGRAGQAQTDALDRLSRHVREHFAFEESELQRVDYHDLVTHRRLHANLLAKFDDLVEAANSDKKHRGPQMIQLVRKWLLDHLQDADKAYAPYFEKSKV